MAATKQAATPKKPRAKKATPKKSKTSSNPGDAAKAHEWLMQSQNATTVGLPPPGTPFKEASVEAVEPEVAASESVDGRLVLKDAKTGQFLPGNKSGGRKKGSRSKLAQEFFDDFYEHWLEGDEEVGIPKGKAAIQWVYKNRPDLYFNGAIKVLPQQMDVRVSEFSELKDDALDKKIAELAEQMGSALAILRPVGLRN